MATIDLIQQMARDNPLWGAERIRGELLKLGIRVGKRTVQKYMQQAPRSRPPGQSWPTFLRNHAGAIWACDFLHVTDLLFRPLFAFFIVEHASRRVVHVGVTRHPTDEWVAQQLREATPYGERPRFLLRDNDAKYGARFAQVAAASGIYSRAHDGTGATGQCDRRALPAERAAGVPGPPAAARRGAPAPGTR